MRYDAVMFDLDGTLADTLADITAAGNHALRSVGLPPRTAEQYRALVGRGAAPLVADLLGPEHAAPRDAALAAFVAYYAAHDHDHTVLYPGVADLLDTLTAQGLKLAVLSNKPDVLTQPVVREVLGRWTFDAVQGHLPGAGVPPKPDPAGALTLCARMRVEPGRVAYVGDSEVDMHTGKSAGFLTVGVSWGFRSVEQLSATGADAIIEHPLDLLALLA